MSAEAITYGSDAANGAGVARLTNTATTPVHRATRAELMNLSPALFTTEFHSACSNAAPNTAAQTKVDTCTPSRSSQNCHGRR